MVKNRTSAFALLIALTAFIVSAAVGAEFYVDAQNGDDNNTGAAWGDAFSTIGNAMASCTGSSSDVIHVAAATYHESINFKSNTVLLGGYPAGGGARHPEIHQTIIDGSGHQSILAFVAAENCTVDGFTLQNGSASSGGAIYCDHSSPAIEHCVFTDNHADEGGAIYLDGSSPTIKDCRILNNTANENGGGLYCDGSNPIIWDTVVDGNSAGENGGGMFCDGSSPSDTKNCLFTSNTAGEDGGAVFCDNSSPSFLNCTFSLNEADGLGGALFLGSYCVPIVINSILWGDSPDEIWGHEEKKNSINITYSNVQQDGFGEDDCQPDDHYNISCNPDFAVRGDEEHDGYFLDQDESPSVSTGDTDKNPYGGYSNSTYVTDVVGYLDMTGGDDVDMGFHYKETGVAYIELASFAAYPDVNGIHIFWETATEIDNAGFALFRRAVDSAEYEQISGLIPSKGNLASGDSYYYFDTTAKATSSYLYSLIDVDTSGKWTVHGPVMARRLMVGLPDEGPLEAVQ